MITRPQMYRNMDPYQPTVHNCARQQQAFDNFEVLEKIFPLFHFSRHTAAYGCQTWRPSSPNHQIDGPRFSCCPTDPPHQVCVSNQPNSENPQSKYNALTYWFLITPSLVARHIYANTNNHVAHRYTAKTIPYLAN
jgi:hypothetical protein